MNYTSRREFIKIAGVGMASFAVGGLLSSCGSSFNTTSDDTKNQVVVAMNTGSEPAAGFDPLIAWGCGEHVHEPLIQSTLITTNAEMGFEYDLATSYECTSDGMQWTFTLRDDAYFSDGTQVRAQDAAFTLTGIQKSDGAEADLSMIESAYATDDTTLVIDMKKPFNALLFTLAVIGVVPEHAYNENYGRNPIGSGRYVLEQWNEGQQVILSANPGYYGEPPRMERVVIVFMEEDAALASIQTGQVDIAYTSPLLSDLEINGYELIACNTVDSRGISLPLLKSGQTKEGGQGIYPSGNDVTSNMALRKAMNYALDRQALVDHVLNGYGSPAYSVCDGMPWATTDMFVEYNREAANTLLDQEGWKLGSDGIRAKEGVRAALTLLYSAGDSTRQALAADFSNQMKEVGIDIKIEGHSWDEIYPREYSDPVLWGWGSNSPTELYELNYSSGWGNFSGYESSTSDAYFDAALAKPDIAQSYELWHKAQWDGSQGPAPQGEASWVWLVNVNHLYFKRDSLDVATQKPHPHGHGWSLINNVDRWSWSG